MNNLRVHQKVKQVLTKDSDGKIVIRIVPVSYSIEWEHPVDGWLEVPIITTTIDTVADPEFVSEFDNLEKLLEDAIANGKVPDGLDSD